MQPYAKPHLSFADQVSHLESLGLDCTPSVLAEQMLHDVGYYRLTSYLYPFRRLLSPSEPKETIFQYRAAGYVPGSKLSEAAALCRFDSGLRAKVFEGITSLELALRVQIAYVLGARDKFGHVNRSSLDGNACSEPAPYRARSTYGDMFDYWLADYQKLISRASGEDFIGHVMAKYLAPIPIWIAIETFDFGGLTRLYGFLDRYDQNLISKRFGVTNGRVFHKMLVGLGTIRNHCAHHNRLWNRQFPNALASLAQASVSHRLWHIAPITHRRKLYVWVAVLASSLRSYDDTSQWHRTFITQMRKFPTLAAVNPESDMGFPTGWDQNGLWSDPPQSTRTLPS